MVDPIHTYPQCHMDDIHSLGWYKESNLFFSGSKDHSVKLWEIFDDTSIQLSQVVSNPEIHDYTKWITALTYVGNDRIVFGTRNGQLSQATLSEEEGGILHVPLPSSEANPRCKERNTERVTCLSSMHEEGDDNIFLVGRPKDLLCIRANEASESPFTVLWKQSLHSNDWVYCIVPLQLNPAHVLTAAVVIGSSLSLYDIRLSDSVSEGNNAEEIHNIWFEDRRSVPKGQNRAHIAHLEKLRQTNLNLVSGSCFDSKIRIFDVSRKRLLYELTEHDGRCWQTQELSPSIMVSGADDGFMKVWDLRSGGSRRSVGTSGHHRGRVSCLLKYDEHYVITSSCANDVKRDDWKGYFSVFDIRRLTEPVSKCPSKK